MQTQGVNSKKRVKATPWVPLSHSIYFLLRKKRLFGLSLLLFFVTVLFTWLGYQLSINFIDGMTSSFFVEPPGESTIWGWIKNKGWLILKWLYLFITRIAAFYLAFMIAYTLTTPGYSLLSTATEKLKAGELFELDDGLSLRGILLDLWEGLKIASFGILVTIAAIMANFIPIIGQLVAFLLYTYYSALMFLDYPASRRRWSLGRKLDWLKTHNAPSFRLGILPALVSMIPFVNIFLMAFLFPILTVHVTLNFTNLEIYNHNQTLGEDDGN